MRPTAVTEEAVLRAVIRSLVAELELPAGREPEPDAVFADLGLDSVGVGVLAGDLEREFDRSVPPELVYDHPTPRLLAAWVAGLADSGGNG